MNAATAFVGFCAAILIAAGIYFVSPVSLALAAILEMLGALMVVAFFGMTDGT